MKAVVIDRYGGPEVLTYREVAKPAITAGHALVKVRAASVNPIDWQMRKGLLKYFMPKKFPLILGVDLAGQVVETAPGSRFAVGDEVFAMMPGDSGAFAEYVAVPEGVAAKKPANMTLEEAASVPATALTALQGLRDFGGLRAGQSVLVNGASGGVGIFAVQVAKALGASVTAVCSGANAAMVRGLGADDVIDYTTTDFTTQDKTYDVLFDCIANHPFSRSRRVVRKTGVYVTPAPKNWGAAFARQYVLNLVSRPLAKVLVVKPRHEDLEWVRAQVEAGKIRTVVEAVLPIAEIVEAQRRSETGRTKGKLVLKVQD
jgi:NADPH:quinone reductase-like Zn-dependent oxidoreductase